MRIQLHSSTCVARRVALLALLTACGGDAAMPTSPHPATTDVFTVGVIFSPTTASISVGDTVRWNFQAAPDGLGHNVVFSNRTAATPSDISQELRSGMMSRVFAVAGTYQYVCTLHGSMAGTVIVR